MPTSTRRTLCTVLLAVACGEGTVGGDEPKPPDVPPALEPVGVIDDDHPTIVHVTFSTPESLPGWVEFGLDGAFDRASPKATAADHVHQLRGLKAGRSYAWRAVVEDGDERIESELEVVVVPPIPADMPTFDLVTLDPTASVANAYLSVSGATGSAFEDPNSRFYVGFIDAEGDFVWYHELLPGRGTSALDVSLDRSSVWWMEVDNFRQEADAVIVRMALDGTVLSETLAVTGHHAAVELSGGRFAHLGRTFVVSPERTFMTDRVMVASEGDVTGTQSVEVFDYYTDWWSSDLSYYWLPVGNGSGDFFGYENVLDMTHSNSIGVIESENALYPFTRVLDTVLKVDLDAGSLDWQLSGLHSDFTFPDGDPVYQGADASHLWSQGHFSQIGPGWLTMFDNGLNYTPPVSSIVEIAYDEASGTTHEVFRYSLPEGGYTESLGDVWKLDSGHYVASWMSLSKLTEVTPGGEVVWQLDTEPGTAVRRIRVVSDLYDFTPLATPAP